MEKLIIAACICGAEVTKEHNPAVPYTVEEIVREAKSAYDAGAAVIHLHVREDDGTTEPRKIPGMHGCNLQGMSGRHHPAVNRRSRRYDR